MNKFQKELLQESLKSEKRILSDLRKTYEQAEKDIDERLQALLNRFNATDDANLQRTIIYRAEYQMALKKQVAGILDSLNGRQFESISDYIQNSYEDGFIGTLYDLQGQGVPLIFPIDQEQVTTAIAKNTKLSKSLYSALGEDVADLKKRVQNELSRGIAQNLSYAQIAKSIKNQTTIGYNRAARVARTEGHRVQQAAQADAQLKAKEAGADVVKQWDATLDGRTRNAHRALDGQIRELDEPFEINGNKAQYPGDFGIPSQDIHCRCVTLTRARWAVDDETGATKFDNETGQLVEIESKSYQDFKKKYWKNVDTTKKPKRPATHSNDKEEPEKRTKPVVLSPEEFDAYVKENGLKEIYRGYSAESEDKLAEYRKNVEDGTVPLSGEKTSALGRGVYYSDHYDEANDYMLRRQYENGHDYGTVSTAALDKDAKVGNYNTLKKQKLDEEHAAIDKAFQAKDEGDMDAYSRYREEYYDIADQSFEDYVKGKGYDAYEEPGIGNTVVINQNALVVKGEKLTKVEKTLDNIQIEAHNLKEQSAQFGKKIGKHAQDFGLDPKSPRDRDKMANIISRIKVEADEIRIGEWRGQTEDVMIYIKDGDVVITRQDGTFISVLKGGINNARVKNARIK